MLEPKLHSNKDQDLLDILMEMRLQTILNHPVVIEVLNLVWEGRFSIDSSLSSLSPTFTAFFEMKVSDSKSIKERIIQNIKSSDLTKKKQQGLQFNIWKHCLQQRYSDEVLLTVIIFVVFNFLSWQVASIQS